MAGIALSFETGEGTPARLVFGDERVGIGRARANEVCLPDPRASARHAEIRRGEGGWWVRDLGSLNGTTLNGELLPAGLERGLSDGDVLEVAGIRLCLSLDVVVDAETIATTALTSGRLVRQVLARLHPRDGLPRLEVVAGPDAGRSVSVESQVRIGRAEHCELALTDALVSREHAAVRRGLSGLVIVDLHSSNRTRVGDQVVEGERSLREGDEIHLGNTRIRANDPTDALVDEIELLPDEAWVAPAAPSAAPPHRASAQRSARKRRPGWEWLVVVMALAAMVGAAYAIYLLVGG